MLGGYTGSLSVSLVKRIEEMINSLSEHPTFSEVLTRYSIIPYHFQRVLFFFISLFLRTSLCQYCRTTPEENSNKNIQIIQKVVLECT